MVISQSSYTVKESIIPCMLIKEKYFLFFLIHMETKQSDIFIMTNARQWLSKVYDSVVNLTEHNSIWKHRRVRSSTQQHHSTTARNNSSTQHATTVHNSYRDNDLAKTITL